MIFDAFSERIAQLTDMRQEEILPLLTTPPNPEMGDAALPCFPFSKTMRKAPLAIAAELAGAFGQVEGIARVEAVGGYLNAVADPAWVAGRVMTALAGAIGAGTLAQGSEGKGQVICLDYSSINIAKRFHIGHLSSTILGAALNRVYKARGYATVSINHLGDWGTQFGKMIAAYRRWGDKGQVEAGGIDALTALYQRFEREAAEDEALAAEGREWFRRMEEGDAEAMEIFNWFKEITLTDANRLYAKLDIQFDSYAGESFYSDKMQPVLDDLRRANLLKESQGAWVVDLEDESMPPCIILKQDGATLYATRDLAAALYRYQTYHFDRCLYVVAYQQDLHFRQLFSVCRRLEYPFADKLEHVSYGMVRYEGETLSTRRGHMVYLDDLLDRAVEKAGAILAEKNPDLANRQDVAAQVGIGAVVFSALLNNRIKDIDFWWDRALNFDGETGPYVQYTHVRTLSVLRKGEMQPGQAIAQPIDANLLTQAPAQAVLKQLAALDATLGAVVVRNEPYLLTRYLVDLAQKYNAFYYELRMLDEDLTVRAARLALTDAVRATLQKGLALLGIGAPEAM